MYLRVATCLSLTVVVAVGVVARVPTTVERLTPSFDRRHCRTLQNRREPVAICTVDFL